MATVYLSIGFPKTGTTAIQTFLRENEEVLKRQGYCFPEFTEVIGNGRRYRNRNGHFLVYNFANPKKLDEKAVREKVFKVIGELAQEYPNIILSDESIALAGARRKGFWPGVVREFEKAGCTLKVIVYLRRQDFLIQSWWNQRVKSNHFETRNFGTYLEDGDIFAWPLDYYGFLKEIEGYVQKQHLIVRVYEKGQFEGTGHSIFSDFLQCLGLELTRDYTRERVERNPGLQGNYIEIKRILNSLPAYRKMGDFLKPAFCSASASLASGETSMFTYGQQMELLGKYEEGNRKTAEEFLGRPDGRLFQDAGERLPAWEADMDTMYRDMILFTGQALCGQQEEIRRLRKEVKKMRNKEIPELHKKVKEVQNNLLLKTCRKVGKILKHTDDIEGGK